MLVSLSQVARRCAQADGYVSFANKSSLRTQNEIVCDTRNVDWKKPEQRSMRILVNRTVNSNILVRLVVPGELNLDLVVRSARPFDLECVNLLGLH